MKESILNEIKRNNRVTYKNLINKFNIDHNELDKLLLELKLDGEIIQLGNAYRMFPAGLCIGNVVASTSGRKYIMYNNEKISIASDFLNGVVLNDVVTFSINDENEAEIYTIVDRTLGKMTCEIKVVGGKKRIIPFHNNIDIKLSDKVLDTLYDGDIIAVNVELNGDATYIETIGRRDDPLIDDVAIALNFGFDNNYDEEYMKEVDKLPTEVSEEETVGRHDYRKQKCFTTDGRYTKDMDDACFGEMLENGNIRVYVHIADVSHYIKPWSLIFKRACEKTTSLYMNNSVFHMLHHIISNGICSLNENKDRLTKTVVMEIDKDGNIVDFDIQKSVINSKKKMVYDDVDEIIMNNKMVDGYEPFEKTLYILYDAAMRLENRYVNKNGKINFANTELDKTYNDDGTIKSVDNEENSIARKIIENLMIAANETVANWFILIGMITVFRVHDLPNANTINNVIEILNKNGYHIKPIKDVDNPKTLQKILNSLTKYEAYPIISNMLVMAMQRARYSVVNNGHYALGLPAYLHFTSPIRRLADLLVHMMIDLVFETPEKITPEFLNETEEKLKVLAKRASERAILADTAEKIAERREILKSLAKNKDVEYEAVVLEVGKKIKIRVSGVDTYIDLKQVKNIFGYDSKRKRFYGRDNSSQLKIGSKLLVKITNIDATSDNFSVKILDMVYDNVNNDVKTKTKKK